MLSFCIVGVTYASPIKVIYPNGGENIFFNKDVEIIRWKTDKDVGDFVIILYRNGVKLFEIKKMVRVNPNNSIQTFMWRYSPMIKEGGGYRIRIRSLKDLSLNDFSDMDFTVKRK
jgi:hypothetical protein